MHQCFQRPKLRLTGDNRLARNNPYHFATKPTRKTYVPVTLQDRGWEGDGKDAHLFDRRTDSFLLNLYHQTHTSSSNSYTQIFNTQSTLRIRSECFICTDSNSNINARRRRWWWWWWWWYDFGEETWKKRPFERARRIWDNNIKKDLQTAGPGRGMDWSGSEYNRWQALWRWQ